MPRYEFKCPVCKTTEDKQISIQEREDLFQCDECYHPLERVWSFVGSVWAPTSSGGGHK